MAGLRRLLPDLAPPAVLAVFLAAYFAPGVFAGQLYLAEDLPQFFAFRSVLHQVAHGGGWSLWDPLPGLGAPRLANAQMGYLSPFSAWFYLVPTARALSLYPAMLLLALGTSSYAFLRVSGLSLAAASFGALAWLGLGTVVDHVQHPNALECLVWLPLALACWTRFAAAGDGRWAAGAGACLAAMVFAGYPQYLLYSLFLGAGWVAASLVRAAPERRGRLALGALGLAAGGLLLGLPQILPTAELGAHSQRTLLQGSAFADQFRATVPELARYLAAETLLVGERPLQVHGGYPVASGVSLLVVGLALYGAWRDRRLLVPLAGAALFLVGMLGSDGPVMAVLGHLPMASMMRAPVRMLVPAAFLLAWCAAWGLEHWLRGGGRAGSAGLACAWLLALGWALNHGSVRWVPPEALLPPEPVRTLREGRLALDFLTMPPLLVNAGLVAGVPSLVVYDPVVPRNWFEAMFASQVGDLQERRDKAELAMTLGNMIPVTRPGLPLLRSFDLRRVVRASPEGFRADPVPPAGGRFFVVTEVRVPADDRERWALAADPSWDPVRIAVLDRPLAPGGAGPARVEVLRDDPDAQDLRVSGRGGLLVVSALYYPGWEARVDGRPAEVLQANLALRAVEVPPGEHLVEWRYRPAWLLPALGGALAGLGALGGLAFGMRPRRGD